MNLRKLAFVAFLTLISACNPTSRDVETPTIIATLPVTATSLPTQTPIPTAINTPIPTVTATNIPSPSATAVPTATRDPHIPLRTPMPGDHMTTWGWSGIQVWVNGGPLASCRNGQGTDFICGDDPKKNIYTWDPQNWHFVGQAELGKIQTISFQFDRPYKTILITANNPSKNWALDYVAGILADGRKVPFGYAFGSDGKTLLPNQLYFDTPDTPLDLDFFLYNEKRNIAPASIMDCGMVGKAPDGNYSIIRPGHVGNGGDVILFRLINNPNVSGGFRGESAYDLVGIEITYGNVPANPSICPTPPSNPK
jgi:hypothetical protein